MSSNFQAAQEAILRAHRIILSTHEEPDADGLGSMLALENALIKLAKKTISFSPSSLPKTLDFLPGLERIKKQLPPLNPKTDLIIGLDYGSLARLEIKKYYDCLDCSFLTFDHHSLSDQAGIKVIESDCSSTAEIIYNFINYLKIPIENESATCLLTGIIDDTGAFRHSNTTAETLKIASQLMLKGARWQKIFKAKKQISPEQKAQAINQAFEKMEIDQDSGLVFSFINYQTFLQSADNFKELKIAGILGNAPEAKIALFLIEKTPGVIEASLRSQKNRGINVAKIAQNFGGGGHKLAAGFRTQQSKEEVIEKIKILLKTGSKEFSIVD